MLSEREKALKAKAKAKEKALKAKAKEKALKAKAKAKEKALKAKAKEKALKKKLINTKNSKRGGDGDTQELSIYNIFHQVAEYIRRNIGVYRKITPVEKLKIAPAVTCQFHKFNIRDFIEYVNTFINKSKNSSNISNLISENIDKINSILCMLFKDEFSDYKTLFTLIIEFMLCNKPAFKELIPINEDTANNKELIGDIRETYNNIMNSVQLSSLSENDSKHEKCIKYKQDSLLVNDIIKSNGALFIPKFNENSIVVQPQKNSIINDIIEFLYKYIYTKRLQDSVNLKSVFINKKDTNVVFLLICCYIASKIKDEIIKQHNVNYSSSSRVTELQILNTKKNILEQINNALIEMDDNCVNRDGLVAKAIFPSGRRENYAKTTIDYAIYGLTDDIDIKYLDIFILLMKSIIENLQNSTELQVIKIEPPRKSPNR